MFSMSNRFIIVDNYNSTDRNNYYGITAFMYVINIKTTFILIRLICFFFCCVVVVNKTSIL